MSVVTHIASVETTSAIWEFDPSLPRNRILNDSLDVISAVWTLAINIQASGQHITYFECLQAECDIAVPLSISLHSNVHWGTADGMLGCAYCLHQPINLFINSADKLFGPMSRTKHVWYSEHGTYYQFEFILERAMSATHIAVILRTRTSPAYEEEFTKMDYPDVRNGYGTS